MKTRQMILLSAACMVLVIAVAAVAQNAPNEAALIDVLKSNAGWLEKQDACRKLRPIGTAACVPALEALLPDAKLSHMARFALESMPFPEAGKALRDALAKADGLPKAGVAASLGVRRDAEAVPLLVPLLKDANVDVACSAAGALGRIAAPDAVKALMDFRATAPDAVKPAVTEGLLAAGQYLTQGGQGDAAATIYEALLKPDQPMDARMGAFRGLAYAQPAKTPERLIAALGGDDPMLRDMAAQIVAETSGADTTKLYADALPKLPGDGQAALIRGLADRKDPAARPAVAKALGGSDREVIVAAIKALGTLGTPEDVPSIAALLVSDDAAVVDAAKVSLVFMKGDNVDAAIGDALTKAAPAVRVQLFERLGERRAIQAVPLAVKDLTNAEASVRAACLDILALLGGKDQVPPTLKALAAAADATERAAVEKALCAMASRSGEEAVAPILDATNGASPESRVVLLRALARIGGPKALETMVAAMKDANKEIGDEAVRLLSNWTTIDAVPPLLELAKSDDLGRQVLGLRGYVSLARIKPNAEERARMLTTAMELAKRPDEKKLVIAAWGTLPTTQSLDILMPYLDDPEVKNEAGLAIAAVAGEFGKQNAESKTRAMDVLMKVRDKCEDKEIRKSVSKAIAGLS